MEKWLKTNYGLHILSQRIQLLSSSAWFNRDILCKTTEGNLVKRTVQDKNTKFQFSKLNEKQIKMWLLAKCFKYSESTEKKKIGIMGNSGVEERWSIT